jgi:hypothetical protein
MLRTAEFSPLRPPLGLISDGVEFEITLIDSALHGAIVSPGFEDWPWEAGTFGDEVRGLRRIPGLGGVRRRALGSEDRVGGTLRRTSSTPGPS